MKPRERGFIGEDKVDHDGEVFDYIRELHSYLWRVVRVVSPGASGSLCAFLDKAIEKLEEEEEISDIEMIGLLDSYELARGNGIYANIVEARLNITLSKGSAVSGGVLRLETAPETLDKVQAMRFGDRAFARVRVDFYVQGREEK